MRTPNIPDSETKALAPMAPTAPTATGLATLADLCTDMAVAPEAARARVSVAELAAMLEHGDIPPPVVERFAAAIGRTFGRTRP
jgi:hypothetical protein